MKKGIMNLIFVLCAAVFVACGSTAQKHEHLWIDASCVAPKTCAICGETEGETIDHDWFEAQCFMPRTCKYCGLEEGEMLEHNFTEKGIVKPAICTMCGLSDGCLPNYFEKNGIPVAGPIEANSDMPSAEFEQQYILFSTRNFYDMVLKTAPISFYVYSSVKEDDETKMVYTIYANTPFEHADSSRRNMFASMALADLYTGQLFEKKVSLNSDFDEYSATLEIEGVEYEITWNEVTTDYSKTLTVVVPADYKGLVYCINKVEGTTGADLEQRWKEAQASQRDSSRSTKYVTGTDTYVLLCEQD